MKKYNTMTNVSGRHNAEEREVLAALAVCCAAPSLPVEHDGLPSRRASKDEEKEAQAALVKREKAMVEAGLPVWSLDPSAGQSTYDWLQSLEYGKAPKSYR